MKAVVLVPGIMGSILSTPQGEEVWPPTPGETIFGYKRVAKLLQDDLKVGDIIRAVSCFDFYQPLIDTLVSAGFKETGGGDRLYIFPYDWRRDLEKIADQLALRLDQIAAAGATSITIVAHSMGGLISRLALESSKFATKPWLAKVNTLMTLGTPHLGAPLALARILGLDSALGISAADFKTIAADRRYPSGYQLLPAPGESACWDIKAGGTLKVLDIYTPAIATKLGMDNALIDRVRWVHDTFGKGAVPAHVRYFYFAGTGHETSTRINVATGSMVVTRQQDSGDGTVPLWSALPRSGQKQLVVGEHSKFFKETNFKAVFFRLFGKDFPTPPTALTAASATLSVQGMTLRTTDTIELLIIPGAPTDTINGSIIIERTDAPQTPFSAFGASTPVAYSGPPVPLLKLNLPPIATPGFYRITLTGVPAVAAPITFAVTV
jgi:hypothetical protein